MHKAWTPPLKWIFGVATLLGFFSALQSYRLSTLNYRPGDVAFYEILILNLVYWYVPASLTPTFFRWADYLRVTSTHWVRPLALHGAGALTFSVIHVLGMIAVRLTLWPNAGKQTTVAWTTFTQRLYLQNLDWTLMTYTSIIGLSYALAYYRESQERALRAAPEIPLRLSETWHRSAGSLAFRAFSGSHCRAGCHPSAPAAGNGTAGKLNRGDAAKGRDRGRISRTGAPQSARHALLGACVKCLGMSSYRLALNG